MLNLAQRRDLQKWIKPIFPSDLVRNGVHKHRGICSPCSYSQAIMVI